MFDKRLAVTGAAIIAVAVLSFFAVRAPQNPETAPIAEQVSGIERAEPRQAASGPDGYQYLLKEHNGRVAVFRAGSGIPDMVFDVYTKYLPDFDRTQMKEGIPVKDYDELMARIEDYIS